MASDHEAAEELRIPGIFEPTTLSDKQEVAAPPPGDKRREVPKETDLDKEVAVPAPKVELPKDAPKDVVEAAADYERALGKLRGSYRARDLASAYLDMVIHAPKGSGLAANAKTLAYRNFGDAITSHTIHTWKALSAKSKFDKSCAAAGIKRP